MLKARNIFTLFLFAYQMFNLNNTLIFIFRVIKKENSKNIRVRVRVRVRVRDRVRVRGKVRVRVIVCFSI